MFYNLVYSFYNCIFKLLLVSNATSNGNYEQLSSTILQHKLNLDLLRIVAAFPTYTFSNTCMISLTIIVSFHREAQAPKSK